MKLITPLALLSYPHLHAPQPSNDGKPPKYSATLVFTPELLADPKERELFEKLQQEALAVIEKKWPGQTQILLQTEGFKKGFRRDDPQKRYPEGSVRISARSVSQPGMVYPWAEPSTGKPARVPAEKIREVFYPGAIVRAQVGPYAFVNQGNKGVTFGLENIQKIRDGERLDDRQAAEDAFTADLSQAPADISALL